MALLDILSREEASYFMETMKEQTQAFNHDFELLFNNRVKLTQPSFNHLKRERLVEGIVAPSVHIIFEWQGKLGGKVITTLKRSDAKILRGLLMMLPVSAIEGTLATAITPTEQSDFMTIAEQLRSSHERVLREMVTTDVDVILKGIEIYENNDQQSKLMETFSEEAYLSQSIVMKINDFPDSFVAQYFPFAMMQRLFALEGVGENNGTGGKRRATKTVLVVDDDAAVRRKIKSYLKEQDLNVVEVDDGIKVLQLLTRMKVDLVFLSLELPSMDGFEICKRVQSHPHLKHIPIIACSAKSSKENVIKAITSGASDFMVKPIMVEEQLRQKIARYL